MDIIFIDTSIFESNNFLESKRIREVYKLAERGDIKIVLPELTYDEIINRISKNIIEASQKFKKYRNDTRALRNVESLTEKFEQFDNEKVQKEFVEKLDAQFAKSNIEIVDYPTLNIKDIFRSYFDKIFPFGLGAKKSEFPDAFALKSIELWADENKVKVIAFSKDNDMLNYNSTHLEIIEDFDLWLSDKIKEIESKYHQKRLNEIEDFVKNKSDGIQKEVANWVNDQLDDYSKYYEYSNYLEVHDLSIVDIKTDIEDYNITNVSEDYISVELKMYVKYKVEIIINDEDYIIKDSDTKEWIFMDTKPLLIDEIRYLDVELVFEIEPDDETVYEPEIETINNGKNLNV
tara:strand:- start:2229 stop:3269 length:1041 start_codon:yes stop_codon:yes gene_type:complete